MPSMVEGARPDAALEIRPLHRFAVPLPRRAALAGEDWARPSPSSALKPCPMKLFLDTADVAVIKDMLPTGMVDGVTTNPSLIAKSGRNIAEVIAEICALVEGPISAEAVATDFETMVKEGDKLAAIAPNVVVKLPLTWDGLRATRAFADKGIKTNVTLCFSAAQAMLAAKAAPPSSRPSLVVWKTSAPTAWACWRKSAPSMTSMISTPRSWPPACATRTT